MPVKLHPDCRKRVVELTAEGIPHIVAKNGMFPDRLSCLMAFFEGEMALPNQGQVHQQLVSYIDEHPLISFFMDVVGFELWIRDEYLGDKPAIKLVEIAGYNDPGALAERLVGQLESLPWKYTWSLRLPEHIGHQLGSFSESFDLGPQARLVRPHPEMNEVFPLTSADLQQNRRVHGGGLLGLLWKDEQLKWESDGAYLQLCVEGYIGQYGSTLPADEAKRTMKAFVGLGIALRLFEVDYSLIAGRTKFGTPSHIYVHRLHGEAWQIDNKLELSDTESRALNSIKLHELNGALDTQEKKAGWAISTLHEMKDVFSPDVDAGAILLASQWLFDSYMGTDELLAFVQAMVVLEILLGDKAASDEIGLGELLRNRCAYLISDTHTERAELLRDFNSIYKVRSKIVHQGKHRLNAEERVLFNKLRWMCRRAISEEVNLLRATIREKNKNP